MKKGITIGLQHQAKKICSDQVTYQHELTNISNNLRDNLYPKKLLLSSSKGKVKKFVENEEEEKNPTVCLPYIKGVSERIQKVC